MKIHKAFVMSVHPGQAAKYDRRHNPIRADLRRIFSSVAPTPGSKNRGVAAEQA